MVRCGKLVLARERNFSVQISKKERNFRGCIWQVWNARSCNESLFQKCKVYIFLRIITRQCVVHIWSFFLSESKFPNDTSRRFQFNYHSSKSWEIHQKSLKNFPETVPKFNHRTHLMRVCSGKSRTARNQSPQAGQRPPQCPTRGRELMEILITKKRLRRRRNAIIIKRGGQKSPRWSATTRPHHAHGNCRHASEWKTYRPNSSTNATRSFESYYVRLLGGGGTDESALWHDKWPRFTHVRIFPTPRGGVGRPRYTSESSHRIVCGCGGTASREKKNTRTQIATTQTVRFVTCVPSSPFKRHGTKSGGRRGSTLSRRRLSTSSSEQSKVQCLRGRINEITDS